MTGKRVCKDFWKPIPTFEGYYEASKDGRIRSVERTLISKAGKRRTYPGRELKQFTNRGGYKRVELSKDGERFQYGVHRLVTMAHLELPDNYKGLVVRHLDHLRTNNNYENLAWGTHQDNSNDSKEAGRLKGTNQNAPKVACPKGHKYDYTYPDGRRDCRTCRNESIRRHRARKAKGL